MKKTFTILTAVLLTASVFLPKQAGAQSPEKLSYQAVIRDASDNLVTEQSVGMQISILQGSVSGTTVYVETQNPSTNANGLVSIEIGAGTVQSGDFTTIDWANGPYFIKTETDPAGGSTYTITGTSQLLSVPYALHAKTAETVTGTITETDPLFGAWDKSTGISITESQISDLGGYIETETDPVYTGSQAANITATDITNLGNLSGVNTGDQDLTTLATKTALGDSTAQVRSEIPDVSSFIEDETDPVFSAWDKSTGIIITESQISDFGTYLTSYTETQNLSDVISNNASAGNANITNLADPVNAKDAATKAYIDQVKVEIFTQIAGGRVTDYDGNTYNTVKIGNQIWMAENLKTTKYNNGTEIPLVTDNTAWSNLSTPGYCWYDNNQVTYGDTYGALYNWYTVETGNLCPTGWHVATLTEWYELTAYLGGVSIAGGKLKEAGTSHWISPNTGATNESGFTALPGGFRFKDGEYNANGTADYWWTDYEETPYAKYWNVDYNTTIIHVGTNYKQFGFSIRCVKD